jgi:hypothetical protein
MGGRGVAEVASEEGPPGVAAALPEDPVPSGASWSGVDGGAVVRVRTISDALAGRLPDPGGAAEPEGGVLSGACLIPGDEFPLEPEAEPVPAPDDEPPVAPGGGSARAGPWQSL